MKSETMNLHFQKLKQQRVSFYNDVDISAEEAWKRPKPDKWSVAETLYHLILLARLFRRFSVIYIPTMLPIAHLRRKKSYKVEIHDIYQEYLREKGKSMPAPFLIKPPRDLKKRMTFEEIKNLHEHETNKLMTNIEHIEEDIAGQIYYPDPIAHYPNLIQSIHLLAIHERHHFKITKKYLGT